MFSIPVELLFGVMPVIHPRPSSLCVSVGDDKFGSLEVGLIEELLSPELGGSFGIIRSEFAPGSLLETPSQRDAEKTGYVASRTFDIEIDGVWFELKHGDSFRIVGEPFRWRNRQKIPAVVV
jgi:hypothetical protein